MKYDIIVIGAGSAGLNIASFMNKIGLKVLLLDRKDENIGGDCLNYGCVPSKALIHVSRQIHSAKEAQKFGLNIKGKVNIKKVMSYIKEKQDTIRVHENANYFRRQGMHVLLGDVTFVNHNTIKINKKLYSGKKIVLATGSRPRKINVPGIEKVKYLTNEEIFSEGKLPKHLLIIGAGPIGLELGQAFKRLGSEVTILEYGSNFLPQEHKEISKILLERLTWEGINFYFNTTSQKFTSGKSVIIKNTKTGKKKTLKFDRLLISVGRIPNLETLNLEKAGVLLDQKGIFVDQYLRTTNKNLFVCGDVAGNLQFTHAAEQHAGIILNNFFSPFDKKLNNDNMAWVTYTSPEIATFGINEEEIKKRKIKYETLKLDFTEDDRAIVTEGTDGKLILYIANNKILGGSMVAENAGELIQELILANTAGIDIKNIFNKIYPYPTATRVNKRIIANHFAKKLTKLNKKILKLLY